MNVRVDAGAKSRTGATTAQWPDIVTKGRAGLLHACLQRLAAVHSVPVFITDARGMRPQFKALDMGDGLFGDSTETPNAETPKDRGLS